MNACGRKPPSRYVVTLNHGPVLRFESLLPSGAISSGRCANCGARRRAASKDQHVLEGVGQMILPADDVADAQIGIVGAGGQMIGRHAVAAQQREILDVGRRFSIARRRRDREM